MEKPISIDKWAERKITISLGMALIIVVLLSLCFFVINSNLNHKTSFDNQKDTVGLEIGSLIRMVKTELMNADSQRINNNESALFILKDFEMEISFTVTSTNRGGAKMDYKFVTVEGGSETANEKIQKLTLHWDAIPEVKDTLWNESDSSEILIKSDNFKIE